MKVTYVKIIYFVFSCIKMRFVPPIRVLIAAMIFFTTFTNYMIKVSISVSIVEMSKPIGVGKEPACPREKNISKTDESKEDLFDWGQDVQGLILAAYFYGTLITYLLGGTMAEMLGAVNVIFWTSLVSAILTGVTPQITNYCGWGGMFAVRFILGVLGAPVYPALNTLIAKWAPPAEKGKFLAMLLGNTIGIVITWLMVGACTGKFGWEWGFYSVSILMGLYSIVFRVITTDAPQKHRWISVKEREYIESSQKGTVSKEKSKKLPPYWRIIRSIHFWATIMGEIGNLWALNLMITYAPKYFKETLGFDLHTTVSYAAAPYIGRLIFSQISGILGDFMTKRAVMSVTNIRKFFVIFSHLIPAICFCFMYLAGCTWEVALFLLITNQTLNGAVVVGHLVTCQDLSPNFAGTLYGIMNWVGGFTGFIIPLINGRILEVYDDDRRKGSGIIFSIGGGVLTLTAIFFFLTGSAEIQPFNYAHQEAPPQEQQTQPTT